MIWSQAPPMLNNLEDTVHVWMCDLKKYVAQYQACYRILNTVEQERANRYRFDEPRIRFVLTRGILRLLTGRYTHREPEDITFINNAWGKPSLPAPDAMTLEFNVAHSQDVALLAFSRNRCVGIDVEFIHPIEDVDHLVKNFFSDFEQHKYRQIPQELQLGAFFRAWTRKEAYIKGIGKGLSRTLKSFDVTLMPGEQAALLVDRSDETAVQQWTLMDIHPGKCYSAALAVRNNKKPFDALGYIFAF